MTFVSRPDSGLLTLADGRAIMFAFLHQQPTYLNLFCGYPTRSINQELIQSHLQMAENLQNRLGIPLRPVLFEPVIAPILDPVTLEDDFTWEVDPFGPYEALPPVLSLAVFDSIAVGPDEACSSVLVVWYQDQFGLPALSILEQLRKLDWAVHARDWTW